MWNLRSFFHSVNIQMGLTRFYHQSEYERPTIEGCKVVMSIQGYTWSTLFHMQQNLRPSSWPLLSNVRKSVSHIWIQPCQQGRVPSGMKILWTASPLPPPLWSHHNNTSGEAVLLSLGPGRGQWGDQEEQIKFRQKCFPRKFLIQSLGPWPFDLLSTKTRTFKTSI